jgi:hypothetical protein
MFKKFLLIVLSFCFLLGMATRKELENVKTTVETTTTEPTVNAGFPTIKEEKGYRIKIDSVKKEEGKWMMLQPKEIRFVSPSGKTVRTIPYETGEQHLNFRISPASNYVVNLAVKNLKEAEMNEIRRQMKLGVGRLDRLNLAYIDKTGKEKWVKEFIVEGVGKETFPSYGIEFSKDGGSIVVYKNHQIRYDSVRCDITVLDTLGKEVISYSFGSMIETGNLQISPDGKLIGAPTYKKGLGDCLFFLDVESGRTKVVKAVGEVWQAWFSLLSQIPTSEGYKNLSSRHIDFWWEIKGKRGGKILTFDEIPSDLTTLFGGKK